MSWNIVKSQQKPDHYSVKTPLECCQIRESCFLDAGLGFKVVFTVSLRVSKTNWTARPSRNGRTRNTWCGKCNIWLLSGSAKERIRDPIKKHATSRRSGKENLIKINAQCMWVCVYSLSFLYFIFTSQNIFSWLESSGEMYNSAAGILSLNNRVICLHSLKQWMVIQPKLS